MKKIFLYSAAFMLLISSGSPADSVKKYAVIELKGSVNPVIAEHIEKSVKGASEKGCSFTVILLNTPGGMLVSMEAIIQAIMSSEIPVIVFTSPSGAKAASAGGFIMLSAHIAAMAPGTVIGAMHPVGPTLDFTKRDGMGGPEGVMEKKVLNDTVAYARSLAQKRGRNQEWAVSAVSRAVSNTYSEALKLGVIDLVADDLPDLLNKIHGRKVEVNGKMIVIDSKNHQRTDFEMNWKESLLNRIADPQTMMLLLILAIAGIGIEFKSPGLIVPGILGAVSLVLFLMAVKIIPVNVFGLLLIALAITLFVLELKFTSYGLLTAGGLASFILGSMLLFDSPLQGGFVPLTTILAAAASIVLFVLVVLRSVVKAHHNRVTTGIEGMSGEKGEVLHFSGGKGKAMVHGEIWNISSPDDLTRGDEIIVEKADGMKLNVFRKKN